MSGRDDFDPMGRAALFLPPQTASVARPGRKGRDALFSAPPRRSGVAVVECSACDARTPLPLGALAGRLLPSVWLPLPGRRHNRYLRCPACRRGAWCRVAWSRGAAG